MQAGKNISASKIYDEKSDIHPYRCVGGNGLRGYTNIFNTEGDFAIIGRQGALCGCLNIECGKFYATEHAVVVNSFGLISSLFIYHFFTALNLNQYATATAQPGLAVSNITEVFIPLPPHAEQLRIVSKIEKLLPLVNTYEQAQNEFNVLNVSLSEQLRKSILQEAIQGKLVPQIIEEGTAQELLEKIKREKLRLGGKLKKKDLVESTIFKGDDNKYYERIGKALAPINDDIPFEIPTSWKWVRLADVVMVNPKNEVPDDIEAAFIPMELIDATYLSSYSFFRKKWKDIKLGFTHFADGDVAFAKITPCFQNRKSMILKGLPNGLGAGTTELKVLRPYGNTILAEYLLFFLESPYFVEEATFKGTANQQRIISGYMETKLFPLPPLSEQQRIVDMLETIFDKIKG